MPVLALHDVTLFRDAETNDALEGFLHLPLVLFLSSLNGLVIGFFMSLLQLRIVGFFRTLVSGIKVAR